MALITITLSDDEVLLAQEQAIKQGFTGIEAYLHDLVAERLHADENDDEDFGAPEHLHVTSTEQFKELIRQGLKSPGRTFTEADFAEMRRELIEKGRISKA